MKLTLIALSCLPLLSPVTQPGEGVILDLAMNKSLSHDSSYRNHKRSKKKPGRLPVFLLCAAIFIILLLLFPDVRRKLDTLFSGEEEAAGPASVTLHVLDVGQGQALLLESEGHYAVIDGGGRETSSFFVAYLKEQGVEKLDLLIATHYDEDHLAGLIGALYAFSVETVIGPDYQADTAIFASYEKALSAKGLTPLHPQKGDSFELGSCTLKMLGPLSYGHEEENDDSLVFRLTCGKTHMLFMGDATEKEEADILENNRSLRADVLVVGHHGSRTSSSEAFLKKVSPSYALISVGADNDYGHPADETLERLEKAGCQVLRTDLKGSIAVSSDGNALTLQTEKG